MSAGGQGIGGQAMLTRATERQAGALDVLMCYQVFLGRDPEAEHVIDAGTRDPVRALVRTFLAAEEFEQVVLERLRHGARLPHEQLGPGPSSTHLAWVARCFQLPAAERAGLSRLRAWPELLTLLCRADGRDRDHPALPLADRVALPGGVLLRPRADCVVCLGAARGDWIDGWAVLPGDPGRRLEVGFAIEGDPPARQAAMLERPEVALLFGGDGRAGFSFGPLPGLAEGVARIGLLRVWAAGGEQPLADWLRVCVEPETGL